MRYRPDQARNADGTFKNENKLLKTVDKSENSDIIKSSAEISAVGANKFEKGFSKHNLDEHWGGTHDHSAEYPGYTKEQYAERALELVQSAADGKNVLGYKNSCGQVVRYDINKNDFVIGRPSEGIATMFKPKRKRKYFDDLMEAENEKT